MNIFQRYAAKYILGNSWDEMVKAFYSGNEVPQKDGQIAVNSETAMGYSAVFACNRVLGETLASMPAIEYKKNPDGTRKQTRDTGAFEVLHNAPNSEMSPFNFKEACMTNINLGGNAVCEKILDGLGDLAGLYPYRWPAVTIDRDKETRKLVYLVRDGTKEKKLRRDQVFHISGPGFDGVNGLSPISYAASAIRLGLSYEKFGVNFYKNGAHASGIFSFPGELGDVAFQRLKSDLQDRYTGLANAGKPILLEAGGKFEQMTISPADAQLIESKKFQVEDICRIYRVPLHLVQNLDRATNNNIEHQSLEFVMYTMLPHFKRWEENINLQLLTPRERKDGYYIEFKIDSLLRGDAKSRAEAYAAGRQWGWLSVNDIRKLENMPPIINGDIYLTPGNMYEAGKEPPASMNQPGQKALADQIVKMISEKE